MELRGHLEGTERMVTLDLQETLALWDHQEIRYVCKRGSNLHSL